MTPIKTLIQKRLQVKEPVKRHVLRQYLNANGHKISDRYMRKILSELRMKDGVLLVTSTHGLKIANSRKDFEKYIAFKRSYALSILKDCKLMARNFNRQIKYNLYE